MLESYEGIEGEYIYVNGGATYVNSSDDGVNSGKLVKVTGGILDSTVGTGDVDGIDSNGDYEQTGGFVISRSGCTDSSGNMAALDIDGTCIITGGTFINAGPIGATPSSSSTNNWVKFSSGKLKIGEYTIENTNITFTMSISTSMLWISSDEFVIGNSYTISGVTTLSWTQSSKSLNA